MESGKDGTGEPICRAAMETDRKQTYRHNWWGRKERVKCMERITWKLTLAYVK